MPGHSWLLFLLAARLVRPSDSGACVLPPAWEGSWFEAGSGPLGVTIGSNTISHKGVCLASLRKDQSLLIFSDRSQPSPCHQCLSIHLKAPSLLQYKTSPCLPTSLPLAALCRAIRPDDALHTLFRLGAGAVNCPIAGPLTFSYSLGPGRNCSLPPSHLTQCSGDLALQLHYQACADVRGSQAVTETLECTAVWKEGSIRYFAARVGQGVGQGSDWERVFRCFVYRASHLGWFLSMSGSAHCHLHSATEGHRTMQLYSESSAAQPPCLLPPWLTTSSWRLLETPEVHLKVQEGGVTLQVGGSRELECWEVVARGREVVARGREGVARGREVVARGSEEVTAVYMVHTRCGVQYQCVEVGRGRGPQIISVRLGRPGRQAQEACDPTLFFPPSIPKQWLSDVKMQPRPCPLSGKFHICSNTSNFFHIPSTSPSSPSSSNCSSSSFLLSSCLESYSISTISLLPSGLISTHQEWQCLASWMGPGVQYSLLSSTTSSSLSCLALWEEQGGYRTTVSLGGCWQGQDRGQEQGQEQEQDHESSTTLGAVLFKAGDCSPQALATANSAPGLPTETAWPGLPTGTPCWFLPILVLNLLANMATACRTGP